MVEALHTFGPESFRCDEVTNNIIVNVMRIIAAHEFLRDLRWVVLDELHVYRGVFGAHVHHILRRLRRTCARLGASPRFVAASATIGNPQEFASTLVGEPFQQANRKDFLLDSPDYMPLPDDSGAHNLLTWMGKSDWDVDWSRLSMPTLVMTGLQDRVFYDAAIVDELYSALPNARRIDVADAGHMLPVETPDVLIDALRDFGASL